MYGIIGEDASDVGVLKVIIRRLANDNSLPIDAKGYGGCAEMLRKGARQFRLFANKGVTKFIVCYDADRADPVARFDEAKRKIWAAANVVGDCCIVIPIQELEAWILADLSAVTNVIKSWTPADVTNPENITDPKEHLEKLSRQQQRPRYVHAIHNERIAHHLNLTKVAQKCPSFLPLKNFVVPSALGVGINA